MNKKNTALKVLCCVLVSVMIFAGLSIILTPKSIEDKGGVLYYQGKGFRAEPSDSLDVMVYGNSNAYAGLIPAKLFEDFGYTSYVSGVIRQTIEGANTLLKQSLKTQKPKVIILEVDCLYQKPTKNLNKFGFLVSLFSYHARWKDLKPRDFYTIPRKTDNLDISKGYIYSDIEYKFKPKKYMGKNSSKLKPISEYNLKQLYTFIETCKRNNIKLIFLELPNTASWNYGKHNFVSKIAKNNNIPFVDLNIANDDISIDYKKDFRDKGIHLNVYGAKKTTAYLGDYLNTNYSNIIKDKRKNSK
ncbi:MAG: hypothetical protein RR355_02375, partial [Oscillospiraceae bacterium]